MAVLYENPRRCGFSNFHLLLRAASANYHGLPMAVIELIMVRHLVKQCKGE